MKTNKAKKMKILVADLEGVFVPEIWVNVARKTKIKELAQTTRDVNDYDKLMTKRLSILKENNLKIKDIKDVIVSLKPLKNAFKTLRWIRKHSQIIILSDTFEEFAIPLMAQLDFPTLLCHSLNIDEQGNIIGYNLRIREQKLQTVIALQKMNYHVIAFGDSYNDIKMLNQADQAFLFKPPVSIAKEFSNFKVAKDFKELKIIISKLLDL